MFTFFLFKCPNFHKVADKISWNENKNRCDASFKRKSQAWELHFPSRLPYWQSYFLWEKNWWIFIFVQTLHRSIYTRLLASYLPLKPLSFTRSRIDFPDSIEKSRAVFVWFGEVEDFDLWDGVTSKDWSNLGGKLGKQTKAIGVVLHLCIRIFIPVHINGA